jgi:DNA-binding transcriptional MerR regulator
MYNTNAGIKIDKIDKKGGNILEKIGDFAKRCEVTIKTLRWYDKLGLLVPDFIDKYTGYRYYSTEKAAEVQRITALKDIGFSLNEIKKFCSADKDGKNQVIRQKRQELEKLSRETAQKLRILTKIEEKLDTDKKGEQKMRKKVDLKFENDEIIIGRWEIVGVVEKKEDYRPGKKFIKRGVPFGELYILPNGEKYGRFSWTKNYINVAHDDSYLTLRYETHEIDGVLHMFIKHFNGMAVMKQIDKKHYIKNETGRRENTDMIDKPFVNDERVPGKWSVVGHVSEIAAFSPLKLKEYRKSTWTWTAQDVVAYESIEFLPDGELCCVMNEPFKGKWTAGITFYDIGDGPIAPTYEIHVLDGKEYLFIEWKDCDYIWGSGKPSYFVFTRDV